LMKNLDLRAVVAQGKPSVPQAKAAAKKRS